MSTIRKSWQRLMYVGLLVGGALGMFVACAGGTSGSYLPGTPYYPQASPSDAGSSAPNPQEPQDPQNVDPNANPNEPKIVVNPWVDPQQDNLSTFAIDVDTASYTYSRRLLQSGQRPPAASVRVEEFVNYFNYKYEGPKQKPFQVHVDGAISPYNDKHNILRVGIQGRYLPPEERPVMHLTFLIDTSCSMSGADRIGLVKKSLNILIEQMRDGDTVALATYAGNVRKVLEPTDASKVHEIRKAIDALYTGGGTGMNSGMQLAYQMASDSFVKGHENRVLVFSDGDANIGPVSHEEILKTIETYVQQGITMTTVGFGVGNYRDGRMEQLANKGNGNSYYIDSEEQAYRVFRDQFISNMLTIAKDVKVQVEFNKDYIVKYRLIGYENRDIADKDFRNDKVDAGELGAGHNVTALYEIQLKQTEIEPLLKDNSNTPLVTVRLRYKAPEALKDDPATEITALVPTLSLHRPFADAPWTMRWATAVMGFAEILRGSPHAKDWTYDQVLDIAKLSSQSNDTSHAELIKLVETAQKLR